MEEVWLTPDGGDTLHKFSLHTTIDAIITKLGFELGVRSEDSKHWTIALGMSKIVHWNDFNDVKNLSLEQYLELYPISEFQKIEGAIPLYLIDSSVHVFIDADVGWSSYFELSGNETLRAIVEFASSNMMREIGEPEHFILQDVIILQGPILDIPVNQLCISNDIRIQALFPIYV